MLSSGNSAQRLRPRATAAPGRLLGHPGGSASTPLAVGVAASRRLRQGSTPRSLPGFVATSPTASAAHHVTSPRAEARPPSASSNGAASSASGGSGDGSNPSISSGGLNGSSPPPADRTAASTSELLRAVLKRRAERLQRQQEAGQSPPPPATPPPQQDAPPRYQPAWGSSPPSPAPDDAATTNGAAAHLNGAASSLGGGPAYAPPQQAAAPGQPLGLQPSPLSDARPVRQNAAGLAREDAVAQRRLATVRFWLKFRAEWGQRLKVVGTHQELGAWVLSQSPELKWSEGDNWHVTVQLPAGGVVEYKYVLLDHSGHHPLAWQQGNNSVLALRPSDELVEVFDNWGADPGAKLVADGGQPVTREHRLLSWASEMEAQLVSQKQDLRRSRMELAAAQEEARDARLEAQRYKAQLRAMEAEKAEAAAHLQQARALNAALQTQLADTTASFQDALRTAAAILSQIEDTPSSSSPPPPPAPPASRWPAAEGPAPQRDAPGAARERRDWSGGEQRRSGGVQSASDGDLSAVPDFFASSRTSASAGRSGEERPGSRRLGAAADGGSAEARWKERQEQRGEERQEQRREERGEERQRPEAQPAREEAGSATGGFFSAWVDQSPPAAAKPDVPEAAAEAEPAAPQQPDYSSVPDFWGSSAPSPPKAAVEPPPPPPEPDYSSVPDFWGSSTSSQPTQPSAQGGYGRRSALADRRSPGVMVAAAPEEEGEASDGERTDSSDDEAPAEAEAELAAAASGARGFAPRDATVGAAGRRRRRASKGARGKARSRK